MSKPIIFPHKFDLRNQSLLTVKTDRTSLTQAPFLYEGLFPSLGTPLIPLPFKDIQKQPLNESAPGSSYIFHTAFCCSTLLAKALDEEGVSLALKEPEILMQLANARRTASTSPQARASWQRLADLVFKAFDQNIMARERAIIKPTNLANNILDALLVSKTRRPIVIIYSDLKSFLTSLLKKKEEGRAFGRKMFNILALDFPKLSSEIGKRRLLAMTDLQIAALAWHMQMNHLLQALQHPNGRAIKTIHCDDFLANTANSLFDIGNHLSLPLTKSAATARANSDVFKRNSKFSDKPFQADERPLANKAIQADYDEILDQVVTWSQFAADSDIRLERMPNNLAPQE